ncbi:PaaX family transcriptional regulator C-terminal domain-containing protein [Chachezhania antarctica]|uniref:PaaX family transcriptional regulator C-terminal domain-containing protein n=1 Tax=Chachezhania antarctica TaxID=2340860 RepID=UPI000EAEF6B1|nr:PaaX family transcriptional regulator C-terminal domain-containing protein [Chachezhania antarctica]|tara:strand:- start:343 stop:1125 length:783 start_codon:yes stop_codon:yes gene_type:complete
MDPLEPLVKALHSEGRLRVWSLVITVFGDLVQYRGGVITTGQLGEILGRVGVEPGTLRTALSRLARDGWVESERDGRISRYRLTPEGVAEFAPATSRIYAAPQREPVKRWAVTVRLGPNGSPEIRLLPSEAKDDGSDLRIDGTLSGMSPAYRAALLPDDRRAALGALARDLANLQVVPKDPLDAAAARMLLIHRWRRIVLRWPDIAPELMPDDAPLTDPRADVAAAYRRLSPKAERWLGLDWGSETAHRAAMGRFGGLDL